MSDEASQMRKKSGVKVGMRIEIAKRRGEIVEVIKKFGASSKHRIRFDDKTEDILKLRKGKNNGTRFRILESTALPKGDDIDIDKLNEVFKKRYGSPVIVDADQTSVHSYQHLRDALSKFYEKHAPGTLQSLDLDTVLFQFHKERAMGAEARHAAKQQAIRARASATKKQRFACLAPNPQANSSFAEGSIQSQQTSPQQHAIQGRPRPQAPIPAAGGGGALAQPEPPPPPSDNSPQLPVLLSPPVTDAHMSSSQARPNLLEEVHSNATPLGAPLLNSRDQSQTSETSPKKSHSTCCFCCEVET